MKLSKETEVEIRQVYQAYWDAYLSGDFETFASFLDDEIVIYGTAVGEIFYTKEEALKFYTATAEEMTGKAEFRNRHISIQPVGDTIVIYEESQLYILIEDTWTYYGYARITGIFEQKGNAWKLVHQHGSFPDSRTEEGQQIASEKIKEENLQLREAVKRRTVELENKTRELEIESALERVRTLAMGMRQPDDMLSVCEVIAGQLQLLGVNGIRNVQTAIIDEGGKETYMNYQYFAQYREGTIEHVDSARHPKVKDMIRQMQASPDAFFSHSFEGVELDEWKQYRKNENQLPDPILEAAGAVHFYFYSIGEGGLGLSVYKSLTTEDLGVFHRFRNVFALAYQRFRDIEQAEVQAREAKIELALERVRARTMAMQHSEELQDTSLILFQQLKELGEPAEQCTIGIVKESEGLVEISATLHGNIMQQTFRHNINEPFVMSKIFRGWKDQQSTLIMELKEEELQKYNQYRNELVGTETFPVKLLPGDRRIIHVAYFSKGMLALSTNEPRPAESLQLLERFAKVFEQTYTRFLDLQKAESQAKEAQIEAALEKVRSHSLAMHHSTELEQVAGSLFDRLAELKLSFDGAFIYIFDKEKRNISLWIATNHLSAPVKIDLPYDKAVENNTIIKDLWKAIENGEHIINRSYTGEVKNEYFRYMAKYNESKIPESVRNFQIKQESWTAHLVAEKKSMIGLDSWWGHHTKEEDFKILIRFAKVFEQAYTRFADLQKAEAQAREAEIELALEKVRSRAMAMQNSNELAVIVDIVFMELSKLYILLDRCIIMIYDPKTLDSTWWLANPEPSSAPVGFFVKYHKYKPYLDYINAWKSRTLKWEYLLEGTNKKEWDEFTFAETELSLLPAPVIAGMKSFEQIYLNVSFNNFGSLTASSVEPLQEENFDILLRFAKVFDSTYTRFNDLKQAEAQTREAQIELALERVRARTMSMQKSEELADAAQLLYHEFGNLGINTFSCGYMFVEEAKQTQTAWVVLPDGSLLPDFISFPLTGDQVLNNRYKDWKQKKPLHIFEIQGEANKEHHRFLSNYVPPFVVEEIFSKMPDRVIFNCANFSDGYLLILATEIFSPEEQQTIIRFAKVFEQTYTRFLDLQKSESQTQKVKIEVALERVRARALAMQEPEELIEVAQVMRHEMGLLGVEELETSSIYIHDEGSDIADCWYAIKDIRVPEKKLVADHITMELHKTWVGREMLEFYNSSQQQTSIVMQGAHRIEWIKYCSGISDVLEDFYGEVIPDRTYHLYKFSNGAIGAAAEGDISEESWELLRRATSVFSLAYSRFKDLTQARIDLQKLKTEKLRAEDALAHLKAAQTQLIQSEKMASLGELTAGIAHEIQNPLNFINNFSEVNTELIEEMKEELHLGNHAEAIAIANDIADNEQKINHHGKRADAIVKGMLQHSRSSSGAQEPTDINALANEYLRLAYHGLRAKDNTFNATMKTDFDGSIGMINVIPQDIGRVILNLITNAFYAASEKTKMISHTPYPLMLRPADSQPGATAQQPVEPEYEPTVVVTTKRNRSPLGDLGVEISVSDNGPGIPAHMLDKIFQPFFTTKPTGQGTGLGLSLSYDIVKAHGGKLIVETKEGKGSVFTIQLPIT